MIPTLRPNLPVMPSSICDTDEETQLAWLQGVMDGIYLYGVHKSGEVLIGVLGKPWPQVKAEIDAWADDIRENGVQGL